MRRFWFLIFLVPFVAVSVYSCDETLTAPETVDSSETASTPLFKAGQAKALGFTMQWATVVKYGGQWSKGAASLGVVAVNHIDDTTFSINWDSTEVGPCAVTINLKTVYDGTAGFVMGWRTFYGVTPNWHEVYSRELSTGNKIGAYPVVVVRHCLAR